MKRSLTDPFNPGTYALLLRSGVLRRLRNLPSVTGDYRATGAAVLRHIRSTTPFEKRRELVTALREIAPIGKSAYRIRMGYAHA